MGGAGSIAAAIISDTMALLFSLLGSCLCTTPTAQLAASSSSVAAQTVREQILAGLVPALPIPHVDAEVTALVPTLHSNGTWPDIDYSDASRSWWFAAEHLRRCLLLASAVSSPHSLHHANSTDRAAADRAFEWWLRTDPQNQVE